MMVPSRRNTLVNFVLMAVLFSANHGCTVACLALATAQLGSVGAWQSGILYLTYTGSAVMGATLVVKQLGARNALVTGMALYCLYVACFWFSTISPPQDNPTAVLLGAAIGGIGGGFLWTAQGTYFSHAAQAYCTTDAETSSEENSVLLLEDATSFLAGIFAFVYLAEEVILKLLSTLLVQVWHLSWEAVFATYTLIAVSSSVGMLFLVHNYQHDENHSDEASSSSITNMQHTETVWYKATVAWQLLKGGDPKMIHMVGLNAVFGFTGAFVNSFVNGQVVAQSQLGSSSYVGMLTAITAAVAAIMSLVFGRVSQRIGKGPVLISGALCFFLVGFLFLVHPTLQTWGWPSLLTVYCLQGIGRSTFEGTLKALFADYFPQEKVRNCSILCYNSCSRLDYSTIIHQIPFHNRSCPLFYLSYSFCINLRKEHLPILSYKMV
jgi:MFS family permease